MAKRILSVIVVLIVGVVLSELGVPRRVAGVLCAIGLGYFLSRSSPYEPSVRDLLQSSTPDTPRTDPPPARDEQTL